MPAMPLRPPTLGGDSDKHLAGIHPGLLTGDGDIGWQVEKMKHMMRMNFEEKVAKLRLEMLSKAEAMEESTADEDDIPESVSVGVGDTPAKKPPTPPPRSDSAEGMRALRAMMAQSDVTSETGATGIKDIFREVEKLKDDMKREVEEKRRRLEEMKEELRLRRTEGAVTSPTTEMSSAQRERMDQFMQHHRENCRFHADASRVIRVNNVELTPSGPPANQGNAPPCHEMAPECTYDLPIPAVETEGLNTSPNIRVVENPKRVKTTLTVELAKPEEGT